MIYKEGCTDREMTRRIQRIAGCSPDGIWGRRTTEAVKAWQRANGLVADGIVGPRTLEKMGLADDGDDSVLTLKKSSRNITDIIIHCTASKAGVDLTVEDIRRIHRRNGWPDIGYHYVVTLDGRVHNGRDVDKVGTHVSGHNAHSIGVVYVGGLDRYGNPCDTRNDLQKAALLSLLLDLRKLYPDAVISGHRDFSPDLNGNGTIEPSEFIKWCPCFDAKVEYRSV